MSRIGTTKFLKIVSSSEMFVGERYRLRKRQIIIALLATTDILQLLMYGEICLVFTLGSIRQEPRSMMHTTPIKFDITVRKEGSEERITR